MLDAVRRSPVGRKASALALDARNLVTQARGQIAQLFGAFDEVLALKAQQQAHMEHFHGLNARGALAPQLFQLFKELLSSQLLTKELDLQRQALPSFLDLEA